MNLWQRTLAQIDKGRSGSIQSIPTRIPKLNEFTEGLEQGRIILIGAETSVGKTSFARDQYMYQVYEHFKKIGNINELDIVFIDFSLEMTATVNMAGAVSRKLYDEYNIVLPTKRIVKHLSDDHRRLVEGMGDYFLDFINKLYVVDEDLTPTKFHDTLMEVAKKFGKFSKEGRYIGDCGIWTPNNSNQYIIVLVDTINLGEPEEENKLIKSVIDRISRISVFFRNKCNFTIILLQQFNAEISAVDRTRHGIPTPLLRDFEDSKRPVKDADIVIGLYDPMRHMKADAEHKRFMGYDIGILKSWFRSAHIMKNRYGENNKFIPLKFLGAVGMFEQLPEAKDMTEEDYINSTKY